MQWLRRLLQRTRPEPCRREQGPGFVDRQAGTGNENELSGFDWVCPMAIDPRTVRYLFGEPRVRNADPPVAIPSPTATPSPTERATTLLLENLTQAQLRQYASHCTFDVIGGQSGKRYRLWHRTMQNIEELDIRGRRQRIWCFHPIGLDLADVLLAQKTALELFEYDALRIAQCYSDFAFNSAPPDAPWR
jgi:hypothetical protein